VTRSFVIQVIIFRNSHQIVIHIRMMAVARPLGELEVPGMRRVSSKRSMVAEEEDEWSPGAGVEDFMGPPEQVGLNGPELRAR